MTDDLSLLFRLRGDSSGVKTASAEARAAVNQLRQSFGPELTQTVTVANRAFSSLQDNLTGFVSQRLPLAGSVFTRVTEGLKNLGVEAPKTQRAVASVADSIQSIASQSGKSVPQIASFLARFIQLGDQAKRNDAAFKFFGGSVDLIGNKTAKFLPELESVGTALTGLTGATTAAGSSIAAMAGPIGIAVLALAALATGAVVAARELFDLTKRTAEFQGKMFDLAQQTGVAVETLSTLEVVTRTTGGNLGSITQALVLFQRKLDEAQDPLGKTAEQFRKFNIDTSDTETSLRSAFNALAAMPEGFAQTNAAAELFGARGGKQVLAILKETNGDLDATTKRLRELGILISDEAALAADRFNDELELLNFELRALGAVAAEELIPALTEIIRSLGELVTAARPLVGLFGSLGGTAIRPVVQAFKGLSLVVQALTQDYKGLAKAIKEAQDQQNIGPIKITDVTKVDPLAPDKQTAQQQASEAVNQADAVLAAVRRKVAEQNQALDTLFQQGRRNRQQQAEETINLNKQVLKAEQDRIDALLTQKEQEIKALDEAQRARGEIASRDSEQYRAITAQVIKLQQERLDKENEFNVTSRAIRAKVAKERADSQRNQIANETDLLVSELDAQIKAIEAAIKRGAMPESEGLTTIEALEKAKVDARIQGLEDQKRVGLLTIQEQQDLNNQLKQLQQERDHLEDEHQRRRIDRERATAERVRDIQLANIDALLEVERIRAERLIASSEALAEARVQSEEQAARKILAIRLSLIDSEIAATEARLKATASIADVDERVRAQAELNNRLKILNEQRVTIEADGNRAVDEARQKDLENERRYTEELEDIREQAIEAERDAAEEVIRLMIASFARRKDIIRAERDLELQREEDRHRRETERINEQKRQVDEEIRLLEKRLERLKVGTTEEIEEHERLIESLGKLRLKRAELDKQQGAEDKRSQAAVEGITVEAELKIASPDVALRDAFDSIGESLTNLAGKFADLIGAGKEFALISAQLASQIGGVLAGAFEQVADAIGQTVSNWVLLGETGPAVMRKILAQALASIAAEAAVNAIKELALGFAMLFINPAASAAHFTAAALWGSIAGVAAIAGRGVAGDLFKPKSASAGSGGNGRDGTGQLDPLTLNRNQNQPRMIIVEFRAASDKISQAFTAVVLDDIDSAGPIREALANDVRL